MESFIDQAACIYHEMMVHPILFTHPAPQKIAIIATDGIGILQQAQKHSSVSAIEFVGQKPPVTEERIKYFNRLQDWLKHSDQPSLDALILASQPQQELFPHYLNLLHKDGLLIQECGSLFQFNHIKLCKIELLKAGFRDIQLVHFPQPTAELGWRSAVMAAKKGAFKRIREKDIFNKGFATSYYNFDTHKAALALPEFIRAQLTKELTP